VTVASARSGYDAGYYLSRGAERTAGGYYLNAAQAGEPPGRWFGKGAEALGLADGQVVAAEPYRSVYAQIHPQTGQRMGKAPGGYAKFREILARLEAVEPHATAERRLELEREAAQQTRRSPVYTDVTIAHQKSISVLHASFREQARCAHLAGDRAREELWRAREARVQEILQEANHAGLEWMQQMAGFTRTGYHGRRAEGSESGRWERALPVVTTWLQGTSRDGDPHDHSHNVFARMAMTQSDGKWRALDTMSLRHHLGGIEAIVDARVQSALTREFGVAWVARPDGRCNEIAGITQEVMDAYSTRTHAVTAEGARLARKWEQKYGREPNTREMRFILDEANLTSRKSKDDGEIDWDQLAAKWDATIGGKLAAIAEAVCTFGGQVPGTASAGDAGAQVISEALAAVQAKHSTWTRSDLMKYLGRAMGPEFAAMAPDERQDLLFRLTGRALAGDGVRCLEAPEWPPLPQQLLRDVDGRSVYTRPGVARYATAGQLEMEDKLIQQAQTQAAPNLSREVAARLLGAGAATLEGQLRERAQDATQYTRTGLRMDQAAAAFHALTSGRRTEVIVGPAGTGKTFTVAAIARAWQQNLGEVIGVANSQAATDVLIKAGITNSLNSTRFLAKIKTGSVRLDAHTLVIIDDGGTESMRHLAKIHDLAGQHNAKVVIAGDPGQLQAVEQGGGMRLLADSNGYCQLAVPVRFREEWEQQASLALRRGDKSALEVYDQHGRITGAAQEQTFATLRKSYVASRLAREQKLIMAWRREDCRELSRQIRDDLLHLGLVDSTRPVRIAEGASASAGDLIVAKENDHEMVTDETGHTLMNNDIFRIESVTRDGLVVRHVIDDKEGVRLADKPVLYPLAKFGTTELAYAVTGHNGMGGTYEAGEALVTGTEPREWLYTAMTRGSRQNTARALTRPAAADPAPGTRPDPELARQRGVDRERAALPAEPAEKEEHDREPVAVLADCMDRTEAEPAARAYQREQLASADHLGLLHARWADLAGTADRERYRALLRDAVPGQYRGDLDTPQATWLYRTMRNAELAGLDPAEVVTAAVNSRPLDGARDVPSVIDTRLRVITQPLIPIPLTPWSERIPQIGDPATREYMSEIATAMDARTERLGEHAAETAPPWAVTALGPVPDHPVDRLDWQQRASKIAAYRELYGAGSQDDPLGPEPPATSPEQRAAWYAGFAAMTRTDAVDVQSLPDRSLRHMRESYTSETGWAPPHVGRLLRGVRLGAEDARLQAIRAAAEAKVARGSGDHEAAARHEQLAGSAGALEGLYRTQEEGLAKTQEDRDLWDKLTRGSRYLAVAADSELRRRHPQQTISALRSAEPVVQDDAQLDRGQQPDWFARLAGQRREFAAKLEERQAVTVPAEDPDREDEGEAWPLWKAENEAILQPPKPEIRPAREVERLAGYEAGG
jgi:conjugative relaxase-like TrwC/TraI family protein